jgi:hypothetical protein
VKTARRDLVDDDLRCDAEAASLEVEERRWDIDHRQQATRAQRAQQARVRRRRLGDVVVHAAQNDGIATAYRQSGVAAFRFHERDIPEPSVGDPLAKRSQPGGVDLAREDMAGRTDRCSQSKRQLTLAGADIRDHHPRSQGERLRKPWHFRTACVEAASWPGTAADQGRCEERQSAKRNCHHHSQRRTRAL